MTTVKPVARIGSPSQLIAYARDCWARDPDGFDEVWCVFDVDNFDDVDNAVSAARRAGIALAISNPCFELWLLPQFADHSAWLNGPAEAHAQLRCHVPAYDKARLDFVRFAPHVSDAIERGRRLTETDADHRSNPSTTVWRLVTDVLGD